MTWEPNTTDDQARDGSGDSGAPLSGAADRSFAPADHAGDASYPASSQESEGPQFPEELREMAEQNAGGWVYDVAAELRGNQAAPPEHVIGAWRIDADGSPSGEYVANPYYLPFRRRGRFRRWWKAAIAVVVLLAVAGAVLLVVLNS